MKKLHTYAKTVLDEEVENDLVTAVRSGDLEETERLLAFAKTCTAELRYYYQRTAEVNALVAFRNGALVKR
jgi:hypothetical protein